MGSDVHIYLTIEEIRMLDYLCESYNEVSRSRILKLALKKLFEAKKNVSRHEKV